MPLWSNWLGNQQATPRRIEEAFDTADVVRIVEQAAARRERLRVVSGGYCWSPLVPVDGTLLSIRHLNRVRSIDVDKRTLTVETGAPLREAVLAAAAQGLSLQSPAMFLGLTVGGLIATGSHGTGRHAATLGDAVVGFELVKPDGSVLQVDRPGGDLWRAIVTNLGVLGVVTAVTLQCEPLYNVLESHQTVPYMDVAPLLPKMLRDHEFVSVFWSPAGTIANFKLGNRTPQAATPTTGRIHPTLRDRSIRWVGPILPRLADRSAVFAEFMAQQITQNIGTGTQVVSEPDFSHYQQIYPPVISSEFAIPIELAPQAWSWVVERLMQYWKSGLRPVNMVVHARFGRASEALIASSSGRASCHIEVLSNDGNRHRGLFETEFDEAMRARFSGRPHWGKHLERPWLAAATHGAAMDAFLDIRHQLDPRQLFVNPFLRDEVFGLGRRTVRSVPEVVSPRVGASVS